MALLLVKTIVATKIHTMPRPFNAFGFFFALLVGFGLHLRFMVTSYIKFPTSLGIGEKYW